MITSINSHLFFPRGTGLCAISSPFRVLFSRLFLLLGPGYDYDSCCGFLNYLSPLMEAQSNHVRL